MLLLFYKALLLPTREADVAQFCLPRVCLGSLAHRTRKPLLVPGCALLQRGQAGALQTPARLAHHALLELLVLAPHPVHGVRQSAWRTTLRLFRPAA